MEKQVKYLGTETTKRSWSTKAREGIFVKPNFLVVTILFLITLLVVKIVLSGLYLHFKDIKVPITQVAMAQENSGKQADAKQAETKQSPSDIISTAASLKKKEQELKAREAAVQKKEQELAPLQAEVDAKIERLNELQVTLTAMAKQLAEKEQAVKDEKISHLVTLYSSMDASKAANIMDKLNLDTVVRILANMKGKSAGQIMAAMSADKGAIISERLSNME